MIVSPTGYVQIDKEHWYSWKDDVISTVEYVDADHTPYTKLKHEEVSTMIVEVSMHQCAPWLQILTEEITTTRSNVKRSKGHCITLPEGVARKLYHILHKRFGNEHVS